MTNIQVALNALADRKQKKISEKYNGDRETYKTKVFESFLISIGKDWKKDDLHRVYLNDYNMFYDFETKVMEPINKNENMDFAGYEAKILKFINAE